MKNEKGIMLTETYSDKETLEFGKSLGEKAVPGTVICLDGDLGTGKTVIAKGIALGLGITEPVSFYRRKGIYRGQASVLPFRCIQDRRSC